MAPYVKEGQIIVNVAKGIEENTLMTLSRYHRVKRFRQRMSAVLSGPSHAEEVGRGHSDNLCGQEQETGRQQSIFRESFMSPVFRVYTQSGYAWGIELGGALEKCHRAGSRNSRWTWLWRQYKGSTDHTEESQRLPVLV